ncbi:MAG TPA: glycosyltransferase [Candidatus Krumholzibacteria bacterium]|nr:glycosyltransferase [Candidatus Krumholzibacteria bacterium]
MNLDIATEPSPRPSTAAGPALADIGVLALVPERWGGMWLSRHQILTRLARYFNVVWHNPPQEWRGTPRAVTHTDPTPPPAQGFSVYAPESWLPRFYRPRALDRATEQARLHRSRRLLEKAGARRVVTYVWQPKFGRALDLVPHDVSCYHIADEYSFLDIEQPIPADERALIERVDQVFVHSPALLEKKGHINPHTAYITNGVDYASFSADVPEPADLAAIPRPRIGYVGRIKSQMDWATLTGIARRRPDWSIVLVGPVGHMGSYEAAKQELFGLSNVHYLGNRAVGDVPAYVRHMDVCLLCYALTDYTRYIFPLKLHEYLATGRPVVGSDIRTLRDFASTVRIAKDLDEWCAAIESSLAPGERSPERMRARQEVARAYDWNTITERIAEILCERLGGDAPARFAAFTARKA